MLHLSRDLAVNLRDEVTSLVHSFALEKKLRACSKTSRKWLGRRKSTSETPLQAVEERMSHAEI